MSSDEKLKACAFKLLARREHSRLELQRKLSVRHFDSLAIESVLHWFQEKGYQSDERFAKTYIENRMRRGYGALKIAYELRERGIQDKSILAQYFSTDDASWLPTLLALWRKKFAQTPIKSVERAQQMRFFLSRGFSVDQVKKLWISIHEYE